MLHGFLSTMSSHFLKDDIPEEGVADTVRFGRARYHSHSRIAHAYLWKRLVDGDTNVSPSL